MFRPLWFVMVSTLALVGCGKDKDSKPQATASEASEPATPQADKDSLRRTANRPTLEPITVEEVQGLLPTPEGATVLTAPTKPERGERVQTALCFDQKG